MRNNLKLDILFSIFALFLFAVVVRGVLTDSLLSNHFLIRAQESNEEEEEEENCCDAAEDEENQESAQAQTSISESSQDPEEDDFIQCPTGNIKKVVDSNVICVSQNQEQSQDQIQENSQNQTVIQEVSAQGGSSSSISESSSVSEVYVDINNNSSNGDDADDEDDEDYTREKIIYTYVYSQPAVSSIVYTGDTKGQSPQVVAQVPSNIKELPKTGLPLVGLGLASLLPGGLIFRKLGRKNESSDDSANSVWMRKQLGN